MSTRMVSYKRKRNSGFFPRKKTFGSYTFKRTPASNPWSDRLLMQKSNGPPAYVVADIKYTDQFLAAPSTSVVDGFQFRLNSCYKPRYSSGGHQPRYFDQWLAIYGYGCVMSTDIDITAAMINEVIPPPVTTPVDQAPAMAIFSPTGGISSPTLDSLTFTEFPGSIQKMVGFGTSVRIQQHLDVAKWFGQTMTTYLSNPTNWFTAAADCQSLCLAFIGAGNVQATSLHILFNVDITYRVKFFSIIVPPMSTF